LHGGLGPFDVHWDTMRISNELVNARLHIDDFVELHGYRTFRTVVLLVRRVVTGVRSITLALDLLLVATSSS